MEIKDLGLIDYQEAWNLQRQYTDKVIINRQDSYLLVCEHPSVLTLGRLADRAHILFSENELGQKGVSIIPIDRGGEITLHAPGQLVVYPILDLQRYGKDLHGYLHKLEQVGIDFLRYFDIMGERISGKTGVWIDGRKIMSIGIGVRKWVSYHGMGININTDLSLFKMIRPCGMDVVMTSLENELGKKIDMQEIKQRILYFFNKEFELQYV